jgi:hypothetical protein
VHNFDPHRTDTGIFWTIPINDDRLEVDWPKGRASFRSRDKEIDDYGDILNAIVEGPSTRSFVSFDIEWFDPINRVRIGADNNGGFGGSDWGGKFAEATTTAEWSGHQPGFQFRSDPASASEPVFGFIGHERNGVFFS